VVAVAFFNDAMGAALFARFERYTPARSAFPNFLMVIQENKAWRDR
jgi:hypothetical protein